MNYTHIASAEIKNTPAMKLIKVKKSRVEEIDFNNIPFGKIFSDHMFVVDYKNGEWINPLIRPYGTIEMSPAISALHYGQAIFEGMKAYKDTEGRVKVFRPLDNFYRLNTSAKRMCMPEISKKMFMEALTSLLSLDAAWVPNIDGCALYIRPVMFATTAEIKVKSSTEFKFVILTCPVGPYYSEPVKVLIEDYYSRAMQGGVGNAKAAGNYGAALYPASLAQAKGYHQLIWTDSIEHRYIEESGTMNIMFIIDGKLVTPSLETNTILPGVTRESVITLAKERGIQVEERRVSVDEVIEGLKTGKLTEAFGTGTAATIITIAIISSKGIDYKLPAATPESKSSILLKDLNDIRAGKIKDTHNWMFQIT